MALSTRALKRNGRGWPIGGGAGHGWRHPGCHFFLTSSHGGLLGNTSTPRLIFMAPAVGGIAHGPVNARP